MTEQPTVIIVDDDRGIREALGSLIRSVGLQAKTLASVPEFLNEGRPDGPTCLALDVRLPGRSGLAATQQRTLLPWIAEWTTCLSRAGAGAPAGRIPIHPEL